MAFSQPMYIILMLLTGILAGVLSGLFGIGGGVIIVPFLVLALRFPHHTANGTSLVALLLPVGALGVYEYYRAGKITSVHIRSGLLISLGLLIGAYIGAKLSIGLSELTLRRSFAIFLVFLAAKIWFN